MTSLLVTAAFSPIGAIVILRNAPTAILILLAASGLGAILIRILRPPQMDATWRLMLAVGLGLGALSLFVLFLGSMGILHRGLWLVVTGILGAVGLIYVGGCIGKHSPESSSPAFPQWPAWMAIPFAGLALLAASMPPGTLWPAEGNGYDVLEYHLAAPREYFEQGRIAYLPHNIYSNFPFSIEMLYLLGMILRGGPLPGALTAQLLHCFLGMLTAGGVWLACRSSGRSLPSAGAILMFTCPFLPYLSGLAYVENGMLFFAALCLGSFIEARNQSNTRWMAVAGLLCGMACGCKYIAVPCLAIPLVIASFLVGQRRVAGAAIFLSCTLVAIAPWLAKNFAATGNPLFPLARSVFHERPGIWTDEAASRWHEGHLPGPEYRSISGRLARLGSEIAYNPLYGAMPVATLAALILVFRKRPSGTGKSDQPVRLVPVICVAIGTLVTWTFFTHLEGRFAITLIPPAAILVSIGLDHLHRRAGRTVATIPFIAAIVANLACVGWIYQKGKILDLCRLRTTDSLEWFAQGMWITHAHVPKINKLLADGRRVLLVADSRRFYLDHGVTYCVVFNRNPFAEAAATLSPPQLLNWLREQGYDYLQVDWTEMRRFQRTYHFWPSIDQPLFDRLRQAGLEEFENFSLPDGRTYSTLYRVPPAVPVTSQTGSNP